MIPSDLPFPFYAFSETHHTDGIDLSFAYHTMHYDDGSIIAMCNDISCSHCPFTCKQAKDRNLVLGTYAREHFPEMTI